MFNGFVIGDRGLGTSGDTHPAWMMAHAEVGPYLVIGASAAGQIHLARRQSRDDAFIIRSAGPWLTVAVADGVGTRPLSRYGATYVVESLTALLLRKLVPPAKSARNGQATAQPSTPGNRAPSLTKADVELKSLAPPPTAEEAELKPWIRFSSQQVNRVSANRDASQFWEIASRELCQAASIGWWPSPALLASLTEQDQASQAPSSSPQHSSQKHTNEQDQSTEENTAVSTGDEPDLREIMNQAFDNTHLGLRQHANSLGVELADLSCTALCLLLNVETGHGVVGQIGDGAVLGLSAQGKIEPLVDAEDTGDPQTTYTISRPNFGKYLAIKVINPTPDNALATIYVMTDGLSSDLLFTPHSPENWAKGVNANLQASASPTLAAAGMLNWLSTYQVKGSWDDRTLIVIMKRE